MVHKTMATRRNTREMKLQRKNKYQKDENV